MTELKYDLWHGVRWLYSGFETFATLRQVVKLNDAFDRKYMLKNNLKDKQEKY